MRRNTFEFLVLIIGILFSFGCFNPIANVPKNSTKTSTDNQILFDDEFNSLNSAIWSAFPSLTPTAGFEGSNIPGEVKVENGILKLSRYAPELAGENQASYIQTKNTVYIPDTFSVTMRFRNEFTAFGFGDISIEIYKHKIAVGHNGLDNAMDNTYSYHYNDNSFFILSFHVTSNGYTINIKEDTADSTEETFSQTVDLSELMGNSTISIWGGSNTRSAQYSEIDYIRISQ
jgi:hypothetical protein